MDKVKPIKNYIQIFQSTKYVYRILQGQKVEKFHSILLQATVLSLWVYVKYTHQIFSTYAFHKYTSGGVLILLCKKCLLSIDVSLKLFPLIRFNSECTYLLDHFFLSEYTIYVVCKTMKSFWLYLENRVLIYKGK